MNGTTLKLPPALKRRIGPLARHAGQTPHAWMVETLKREAERAEQREQFIADAVESVEEIDAGGPVYASEQVHDYLLRAASGRKARRPTPLKKSR